MCMVYKSIWGLTTGKTIAVGKVTALSGDGFRVAPRGGFRKVLVTKESGVP
ncbi:hypothetical protein F2Q69_00026985 [Brassica cretica]|uniref:Uncharacterized protein n=1 Tax=Brassica cretica TaxID=69181 RepID=A0A8S9S2A6_BRACR|nr:hypothetical protein F2Q69_00026985 [Brassica cretica]